MLSKLIKTLLFVFFVLAHCTSLASEHWVKVVDQEGAAVENAIVRFEHTHDSESKMVSRHTMRQIDMQFSPKVLIITKGEQVIFPNEDKTRHHVYSFSKPKTFEIKLYKGLPSEPLTFETPGLVILGCNIHDSMVGYIYVTDNEIAAVTDGAGMSHFNKPLPPSHATIWHADNMDNESTSSVVLTKTKEDNVWLGKITLRRTLPQKTNTFKHKFGR